MRRGVTPTARDASVLSFEQISRGLMIECLRIPFDQRKVFAVVLRVTTCAFLARSGWQVIARVQASVGRKPR